jgi:hypothetical protein
MPTMKHRVLEVGGKYTVLALHGEASPDAREWAAYIKDFVDIGDRWGWYPKLVGGLAITDGGGPNTLQRADVNRVTKANPQIRGAAVTNSVMVRGIVTALSWMNSNVRAFSPDRLDAALVHLELPVSELHKVWGAIEELAHGMEVRTVGMIANAMERSRAAS